MTTILLGGKAFAGSDMININSNDTTAQFTQGSVLTDTSGGKYVYVKFGYTSAVGDAVVVNFADATNNALGLYRVIQPTTATLDSFAGIALTAVTSGNFGWVQVSGWNQVALASTTATAGDSLKCANASSAMVNDTAQGINPTFTYGAKITTAVAAAAPAVGTVYIYGILSALCQ